MTEAALPSPAAILPYSAGIGSRNDYERGRMNRNGIFESVAAQIAPFNAKDIALSDATSFQHDLEWDSLTVMDFVAAVEDEFDILITMNMQAEIETIGQLVDAVGKLRAE